MSLGRAVSGTAPATCLGAIRQPNRLVARLLFAIATVSLVAVRPAAAFEAGDAIRLAWQDGDLAGMSAISSPEGEAIGFVEYRQHRSADLLTIFRLARFSDGSSDEDHATVRIGKTLQTLRGRSIVRNTKGVPTVDVTIDVDGGRISGFAGVGDEREDYDKQVELPPGTYWGALISLVAKNFDINATDGNLVFRSVICTPQPRVFDMELHRQDGRRLKRPGGSMVTMHLALRPTVNWLVDPIIRAFAPDTSFFLQPGAPPALARFEGPRNYAGQKIRIE